MLSNKMEDMLNKPPHSFLFEKRKLIYCVTPGAFWDTASVTGQRNLSSPAKCSGLLVWFFIIIIIFFPPQERYSNNIQGSSHLNQDLCVKDYHKHRKTKELWYCFLKRIFIRLLCLGPATLKYKVPSTVVDLISPCFHLPLWDTVKRSLDCCSSQSKHHTISQHCKL